MEQLTAEHADYADKRRNELRYLSNFNVEQVGAEGMMLEYLNNYPRVPRLPR